MHTFQTLSAKPLETEMPISTNAFQPNGLMSAHGTFISDWTQRIYWVSVQKEDDGPRAQKKQEHEVNASPSGASALTG